MSSPFYRPEHEALRRFVDKEVAPFAHPWDESGEFPRDLYRRAGDLGLLGGAEEIMKDLAARQMGL